MDNNLISCCGLNCAECDARTATLNNDEALRAITAEKWRIQYASPNIKTEDINCTGCRMDGAKIGHHAECSIRSCASSKTCPTCGQCSQLDTCEQVGELFKFVPDAKQNLLSLN